jgi:hypothetical protein
MHSNIDSDAHMFFNHVTEADVVRYQAANKPLPKWFAVPSVATLIKYLNSVQPEPTMVTTKEY